MDKDTFLSAISSGMDIQSAAYLIGASPDAIFRLLERGKKEQARISGTKLKVKTSEAGALELWIEVAKARSVGMLTHLNNIRTAGAEDWKASKFILEHMNPGVFASGGSVNEIEATGLGEIEAY